MVNSNQKLSGFTLVEFLVVTAILGIVAVIALPSFLNQNTRCCKCMSGAQQYVGSLARAQQAYLLEEKHFSSSPSDLGLGVATDTEYYTYSVKTFKNKTFAFAKTKHPKLKSYVAGVFASPTEKNASTMIMCHANEPGTPLILPPMDATTCGEGTVNTDQIR
jgi:type IV pilus assembly protein PilA